MSAHRPTSRAAWLTLGAAAAAAGLLAVRAVRRRYRFQGKVVVITGGSRGLGLAMARMLASEGAHLALLARTAADLRNAEDHINASGGDAISIPCDVRNQAEIEAAIALVIERYGRIDVLINNAGIIQVGPIDNMGVHDFDDAMATHCYGPLFATLEVLPHMRRQGGGRIVNIASIAGMVSVPHMIPYCASKFALVGLSDGLRAELARDNIIVTTVCPWFMRTGSLYNVIVKGQHEREFAWMAWGASIPVLTMNADRAARKIIEACRRGSPRLIMSVWGKAAAFVNAISPRMMAIDQRLAAKLLPEPDYTEGDIPKIGWSSRSSRTPDRMMTITKKAALRNNELRHAIRESQHGATSAGG